MESPRQQLHSDALTVSRAALLNDGRDDDFRDMLHDMLSFFDRLEGIRDRFGAFLGLSGPQYTIVVAIRQLQGATGIGVKELADHLGLSGAFVTIETKKLVRLGVVRKETNPGDQRRVFLTLTPQGVALLCRLAPHQRAINDTLFEPLTAAGFRQLCKTMARLRLSVGQAEALADTLLDDGKEPR